MKKNIIEELISEDTVYHDNLGQRYDWMQKQMAYGVSILDILKLDAKDMEKAKAILPYQAEPVLKIIEEQMISLCGLKKDLINIINNPLIKRDAPKVKIIKRCLRKTNGMIKAYSDILKLLDGLRLE